MPPVANEVGQ